MDKCYGSDDAASQQNSGCPVVTDEMIQAGIAAYRESISDGEDAPYACDLDRVVAHIFLAMMARY